MIDMDKIYEIAKGLHHDIGKLDSLSSLLRDIEKSLHVFISLQEKQKLYEYDKLKKDVADLSQQLKLRGLPENNKYEKDLVDIKNSLNSDDWPECVPDSSICDSEEKADLRSRQILDQFVCENMANKKFLDYGCGDGLTVKRAKEKESKFSLGYDLLSTDLKISTNDFTNDFKVVEANGPYDIVLVHDVLDHLHGINPIEALIQIRSVISPNGRLYVKNHPWSSRHGGHLYTQKNKAFLHLVLDEVELARVCGIESDHNLKITTPIDTYYYWFQQSGFKIVQENLIIEEVEEFFQLPSVAKERITERFKNQNSMMDVMKISFIEYVLEPSMMINI